MADKKEIAKWLIDEIRENGPRRSYQSSLVRVIREKFGDEWSYTNHNGNPAIDTGVLREFGKLKDDFVQWDRSDQSWRIVTDEQLERIQSRAAEMKRRAEERASRLAEYAARSGA